MRALALNYDSRLLEYCDVPEPGDPGPREVLLEVLEVGVCGTDRDLAQFRFGTPPKGETRLILGHEALARVRAVGSKVSTVVPGDLVVPRVRHRCLPACQSCGNNRSDLCLTGGYKERGIVGLHGFFAPLALDDSENLQIIPPGLENLGVLVEPLSVVEKAWELALRLRQDLAVRNVVVIGAGAVGLLIAFVARLHGCSVTVVSREPVNSARAKLVRQSGCAYQTNFNQLSADVVIEAAGSTEAGCQGLECLAACGVLVALGAPDGIAKIPFLKMIVGNQILAGSVNAAPHHFDLAVNNLRRMDQNLAGCLVERRSFRSARETILSGPGESVKVVHRFDL